MQLFKTCWKTDVYFRIINRASARDLNGYKEKHHVFPKCLGGDNSSSNVVNLTAKEHYICHMLLTKIIMDSNHKRKMIFAFDAMSLASKNHNRVRISSIIFDKNKRIVADQLREMFKGKPKSKEHKLSMRGPRPHVNQAGSKNNNAKTIKTPFGIFGSIADASEHLGIAYDNVHYKLRAKHVGWEYVI